MGLPRGARVGARLATVDDDLIVDTALDVMIGVPAAVVAPFERETAAFYE
jgi:hypothetical protein